MEVLYCFHKITADLKRYQEGNFVILHTQLFIRYHSLMITKNRALFKLKLSDSFHLKGPLFHLIFPEKCIVCQGELSPHDAQLCPFCLTDLDYTHYEKYLGASKVDKLFWGRVPVEKTYSHLFFKKGGSTQQILHELKYTFNAQVGRTFGEQIGHTLKEKKEWSDIDFLVPVPIHPKKAFSRGYNQSVLIAEGISKSLGCPIHTLGLKKTRHTTSQTQKGRFLRWDNVNNNFSLTNNDDFNGKHIAFVDDVITTGATLESLIRLVLDKYPDIRISIISLAFAA
jgi:ComF family protein